MALKPVLSTLLGVFSRHLIWPLCVFLYWSFSPLPKLRIRASTSQWHAQGPCLMQAYFWTVLLAMLSTVLCLRVCCKRNACGSCVLLCSNEMSRLVSKRTGKRGRNCEIRMELHRSDNWCWLWKEESSAGEKDQQLHQWEEVLGVLSFRCRTMPGVSQPGRQTGSRSDVVISQSQENRHHLKQQKRMRRAQHNFQFFLFPP